MTQLPSPRSRVAGPAARASRTGLLLLGALAAAICLAGAAEADEPGLSIEKPWIRMSIPSRPAAGYFTLRNDSAETRALTGAQSPACGMLMLHRSVHEGGQERMIMVKDVPVPAHGAAIFSPGGYHLMCMSPTKAVTPGQSVPVTLKFDNGGTITASFPVRNMRGQ